MNDRRALLTTLWIFVTFDYLYCDLIGMMDPAFLSKLLTGVVGTITFTPSFLLGASILMQIPMGMVYHWRFNAPGKTLHMHIENHQASKVFDATLALSRVPLTRANLRGLLLRLPMMTLKTVLAIYWQALRLWLKRVPLYNHPVSRSERS